MKFPVIFNLRAYCSVFWPKFNRMARINMAYSIRSGVNLYPGYYGKESHPLSKHEFTSYETLIFCNLLWMICILKYPWHTIQQNIECDKLDGKLCRVHTIRFLSYEIGWSRLELDGTRTDPYDVISSLLEKKTISPVRIVLKIKKSMVLWTIKYNLNYNDRKELIWWN